MSKLSLYWFRKGLRIHDNPGLLSSFQLAHSGCIQNYVLPFFIVDPSYKVLPDVSEGVNPEISTGSTFICSHNRYKFLHSSLIDLDANLKSLGSSLFCFYGNPSQVFESLFNTIQNSTNLKEFLNLDKIEAVSLYFEYDSEPYAVKRDDAIETLAKKFKIPVQKFVSHTLFDPRELFDFFNEKTDSHPSYEGFLKKIKTLNQPKPCETLLKHHLVDNHCILPKLGKTGEMSKYLNKSGLYEVYETYQEFSNTQGFHTLIKVLEKFPGGETEGLKRLRDKMSQLDWINNFEKPNTSPNSLEPSTTVLSPYLKFGCVSARTFYQEIRKVQNKFDKSSQPPMSLIGQLYWRDFFYCAAFATPNFHQIKNNPRCRQISWDQNDELFVAWANAKTGYPFIDAIMRQLKEEGWIHHLARHAVACFLTRGNLYQSWEMGQKVFEQLLLDADYSLNAANWQWLSCSSFFYQYFRVYSPIKFGQKTDKNGDFIRKYVPILKDFPAKYIYEPWTAPLDVQKKCKCIVGKDYPHPIVNDQESKKTAMYRMSLAYAENKKRKETDDDAKSKRPKK